MSKIMTAKEEAPMNRIANTTFPLVAAVIESVKALEAAFNARCVRRKTDEGGYEDMTMIKDENDELLFVVTFTMTDKGAKKFAGVIK